VSVRDQTVAPTDSGATTTAHALLCPADLVMRWRGSRRADYTHSAGGHKHTRAHIQRVSTWRDNKQVSDYGYRSAPGKPGSYDAHEYFLLRSLVKDAREKSGAVTRQRAALADRG
jgi:hypothetical protein